MDDYHRADDPKRDEVVRMVPRLDPLLRTESLLEAHRAHLQLQGLETLPLQSKVAIYTDSKYVQEGIGRSWARNWRANDWRRRNGTRTNSDLWDRLLELCDHHEVEFIWLPGHSGNGENERCDWLATQAARRDHLGVDLGYRGERCHSTTPEKWR